MMNAVLETALNHLLTTRMGNPKLADIFPYVEMGNVRSGKIAFIRAYDLLSEESCLFIRYLGQLRNTLAHNIKNFDFNLNAHLAACAPQERKNWVRGLVSWASQPASDEICKTALQFPRKGINNAVFFIVFECIKHQKAAEAQKKMQEEFDREMKGLGARYQSTPKE